MGNVLYYDFGEVLLSAAKLNLMSWIIVFMMSNWATDEIEGFKGQPMIVSWLRLPNDAWRLLFVLFIVGLYGHSADL